MLARDASDQHPALAAHVLAQRAVDGDVASNGFDQLACDRSKRLVTEHPDRAIIGLKSVVEGKLVLPR